MRERYLESISAMEIWEMLGLSWVANMFPHMVKQLLTGDMLLCVTQDFQGQRLAEQLFQYIILLFGVSYYN